MASKELKFTLTEKELKKKYIRVVTKNGKRQKIEKEMSVIERQTCCTRKALNCWLSQLKKRFRNKNTTSKKESQVESSSEEARESDEEGDEQHESNPEKEDSAKSSAEEGSETDQNV
jgi:hypothetical protein